MNTIDLLFNWLVGATLRASALAVVVLCVQWALRKWMPPQWRYVLWMPMLLVLVLPVLPAVPFGIFPIGSDEVVAPTAQVAVPTGAAVVEAMPRTGALAVASAGGGFTLTEVLAVAWLTGACVVLGAGLLGYERSMRRIAGKAVALDGELRVVIDRAAREAGLKRVPRVVVSKGVESPAVTGVFRRTLLLPAGFPKGFSAGEARLILLHEFTHLKRHDLPVNWVACVLQAMHWFNPVLWFAFARMRADREAACDAGVLSLDGVDVRREYGGALLKMQGAFSERGLSLGFVGIFESSAGMKSRIRDISGHRQPGLAGKVCWAGILAGLVLFGATKAEEPAGDVAKVVPGEVGKKKEMTEGQRYIEGKMDRIRIPQVAFENTTLEEAVDFLRLRAKELDTMEVNPTQKGFNFVIRKPRPVEGKEPFEAGRITVKLQNVTVRQVADELAKQSGMKYGVDDFAVTFLVPTEKEAKEVDPQGEEPAAKPAGKAVEAANKLIIPRVDFEDVSLEDAVAFMNQRVGELTTDGPVYPIVIDAGVGKEVRIKELRIRNVPVSVALKYLAEQGKLVVVWNDEEIRLHKR